MTTTSRVGAATAASLMPQKDMNELHELRVRIPVDLHRQLLSLKILRGRSLADTVSRALDSYFAEREASANTIEEPSAMPTSAPTRSKAAWEGVPEHSRSSS